MTEANHPLNDLSTLIGCGMSCSTRCSDQAATEEEATDSGKALASEGWIARSTIDEPRLSEIAETYQDIGYDIKIIYSRTESPKDDCTICFDNLSTGNRRWGTVYVRKRDA